MGSFVIDLGPFEKLSKLHYRSSFPKLVLIRQQLDSTVENDLAAGTHRELSKILGSIHPGMRIAITAGSRGICDLVPVLRAAGEWLRQAGCDPFVVPAMGSHAGASAKGQVAMLAQLGIDQDSVGMSIEATMQTEQFGSIAKGPVVHLDRLAAQADGILLINRVKAHTDFHGKIESGLAKILAIGLGNKLGAEQIHSYGPSNLATLIPQVARRILATNKVIGGLGLIENGYEHIARIVGLQSQDIAGQGESALLVEAKKRMARLFFDEIDVAIIDEMGKDKSGTGLDTNVIGRMRIEGSAEPVAPQINNLVVLTLSKASHGNALGMGLADFVPFRFIDQVDLESTYINALASGLAGSSRVKIPLVLPTDQDAIAAAIASCGKADLSQIKIVRMRNTLELGQLWVSESLVESLKHRQDIEVLGPPQQMEFDSTGTIESMWNQS